MRFLRYKFKKIVKQKLSVQVEKRELPAKLFLINITCILRG